MLVLQVGERNSPGADHVRIETPSGEVIVVEVLRVMRPGVVRLGFTAERAVKIRRGRVVEADEAGKDGER